MSQKPVAYIISADDMHNLRVVAQWYIDKDHRDPPKLGEFKAEVIGTLLDRAVAVNDDEARRMLPQFYGTAPEMLTIKRDAVYDLFADLQPGDPDSTLLGPLDAFAKACGFGGLYGVYAAMEREEAQVTGSEPVAKSFIRDRHWQQVVLWISGYTAHCKASPQDTSTREELLAYAGERRDLARSEGYEEEAAAMQKCIDELKGM